MTFSHHDRGDDGDECVAVGQQSVGGLGSSVGPPVWRTDAPQEGGGRGVAPGGPLLHLLLDVVLDDVAVVVSLHDGGRLCLQTAEKQLTGGGRGVGGRFPETVSGSEDRWWDRRDHSFDLLVTKKKNSNFNWAEDAHYNNTTF